MEFVTLTVLVLLLVVKKRENTSRVNFGVINMAEKKCDYTYLTAIQNCGWWFVIAVHPSGENEFLEAFTNFDDAEWYGSTQAL